jgi:hypothetical protein
VRGAHHIAERLWRAQVSQMQIVNRHSVQCRVQTRL